MWRRRSRVTVTVTVTEHSGAAYVSRVVGVEAHRSEPVALLLYSRRAAVGQVYTPSMVPPSSVGPKAATVTVIDHSLTRRVALTRLEASRRLNRLELIRNTFVGPSSLETLHPSPAGSS